MTAYRFCRTDDMGRLVEAHNRCWLSHHPGEPPLALPGFKRLVRDLHLWCSSCLIALEGQEAVGFLYGCKRESETLLLRLAVHPDHLRRGHGRHLLTSISSKLAILGPPRLVAEVPEEAAAARALLRACEYEEESTLTDWRREAGPADTSGAPAGGPAPRPGGILVPISVADLQANGLLASAPAAGPDATCWERATPSLLALGERLGGLGLVRGDRVAAFILYIEAHGSSGALETPGTRIAALRTAEGGLDGESLDPLVRALVQRTTGPWLLPKATEAEFAPEWLEGRGFRPVARYHRMAATARPA